MPNRTGSFEMVVRNSCKKYILYVPTTYRINKTSDSLKVPKSHPNSYMMGVSEHNIFSWFIRPDIVANAQRYLENTLPNSRIVKIVFTDSIGDDSPPKCLPYYCFNSAGKLKYLPCECITNGILCMKQVIGVIECDARWHKFVSRAKKKT